MLTTRGCPASGSLDGTASAESLGATITVRVALDQYEVPLSKPATTWAEIVLPDGTPASTLILAESAAGRYAGTFATSLPGVYTVRVRARGLTLEGQRFEREQKLTAVVYPGGDQPAPQPSGDPICQLIECLRKSGVLSDRVQRNLGSDLDGVLGCLEEHCRDSNGGLGGETPYDPTASMPVPDPAAYVRRGDLSEAILELERAAATHLGPARFADAPHADPLPAPVLEPMVPFFFVKDPAAKRSAPVQRSRRKPKST